MNKPGSPNQDEIAIAAMEPARPGAGMLHTGSLDRVLTARVKDAPGYNDGYDITWVRHWRAFRVDHYHNNELRGTRWVPEGRVNEYTVSA